MVIIYNSGNVDERECVDLECTSQSVHAVMVNDDYTLDRVFIDDVDRYDGKIGRGVIDASDETHEKVREKLMVGRRPYISLHKFKGVKIGDVVEVVKGRKYNIGDEIEVADLYRYTPPYGRDSVDYIRGTKGEKIQAKNCKIIKFRNSE